jgi:hypothetical protein
LAFKRGCNIRADGPTVGKDLAVEDVRDWMLTVGRPRVRFENILFIPVICEARPNRLDG